MGYSLLHQLLAKLAACIKQLTEIFNIFACCRIPDDGEQSNAGDGVTRFSKPVCMDGFNDRDGLANFHSRPFPESSRERCRYLKREASVAGLSGP